MDAKTLKALKGSIKKWAKIERSERALDKGWENCPLCVFGRNTQRAGDMCISCPVKVKIKDTGCEGTPYIEWGDHHVGDHAKRDEVNEYRSRAKGCKKCLKLATKERKFLESLLPKGGASE